MANRTELNAGAIALKRLGLSGKQIAQRLGMKSDRAVAHWCSGRRKPLPHYRKLIHAEFGIAEDAWDQPPPLPKRAKVKLPPAGGSLRNPIRERAGVVLGRMDRLLLELETGSSPGETSQVLERVARTLAALGKMTGQTNELSTAVILETAQWRKVEDMLIRVLEPWPDAARAVVVGLKELKQEE